MKKPRRRCQPGARMLAEQTSNVNLNAPETQTAEREHQMRDVGVLALAKMILAIDVFVDFVCPWCFIGTRRLEQAIASLDESIRPKVSITHRPFVLIPSTPVDGVEVLT